MSHAASIFSLDEPGIRERWSALHRASVIQTPFAALHYVEDLADVLNLPVRALFVRQEEKDIAGALVILSRKLGIPYVSTSGFTPFSAIAATRLPREAEIHARESWLDLLAMNLGSNIGKVDLFLPPLIRDVRSFQWSSWRVTPFYTFRLSISDPDLCISNWSEGARRIHARMGNRYQLVCSDRDEHEIVRLALDSYNRQNRRPPLSSDKLEGLVLRQVRRKTATCYTVHENESQTPSAGVAVLGSGKDAYYWVAGSTPGPAMTVLIGKMIYSLSQAGYQTFDMVGANTPSIAEFKRRLNPSLVSYFHVHHVRSRMLRILVSMKEAVRH